MAVMIPPILPNTAPPGEQEVFRRLANDPETHNWLVLHSLDIPRHITQVAGEADFVIIVPGHGVAVLEVKSHAQIRRNAEGLWFFGKDPFGEPRGPFRQAADAMHSIRRQVVEKRPDLGRVVFWSAVVLPRASVRIAPRGDWHSWQLIDASRFRGAPISHLILGLLENAREHLEQCGQNWFLRESQEPYPEQCRIMAELLRPSFEAHQSPVARKRELHEQLLSYTGEQFAFLDQLSGNPRLLVQGPAGTGKTVLAIETARRASAEGKRAALLCFNRLLGANLSSMVSGNPLLHASTIHKLMLDISHLTPPAEAAKDPEFWTRVLPEAATSALLANEDDKWLMDELILDEFQDFQQETLLDFLDLILKGGLAAGRWRAFGDFARQNIYAGQGKSDSFRSRLGLPTICHLMTNCRNTPRIAEYVRQLGQLEPFYQRILRPDDGVDPDLKSYSNSGEQIDILKSTIEGFLHEGYKGGDIVVLSPLRHGAPAVLSSDPGWVDRLKFYPERDAGSINWTTIHAFKGLESPVIIITDMDHLSSMEYADLFYIGITRALQRLVILLGPASKAEIARLLS